MDEMNVQTTTQTEENATVNPTIEIASTSETSITTDDVTYPSTGETATEVLDSKAPLLSPAFIGAPTATTAASSDDSTRIATTAFVKNVRGAVTVNNLYADENGNVQLSASDVNAAATNHEHTGYASADHTHTGYAASYHTHTAADVGLGNVTNESKSTMFTSPAFTGTPTAPTAAAGTNTTQIATTAFVTAAVDAVELTPGPQGPAGADGSDGADGASAYDIAVANGFVGTQTAWLASLVGPAGADGADGADGSDATVTASGVLDLLKTVDGANSGVDADLLDGQHASAFAAASHTHSDYADVSHTHTGFASATHNHDSDYAAIDHTHTNFASATHNHDSDYAAISHTHSNYADSDHTHTAADVGAAAANHTHTAAAVGAAAANHTHTAAAVGAAAANHTHSNYALTSHNHDSDYADISHTHSNYAASDHTHTAADVGAATANHTHAVDSALSSTSTNPVQNKVINAALAGKAAATHTHDYAASNHTHTPASIGASATSHTHSAATTSAAGFMSAADKSKLDGIASGANKTTVDSALSSTSTNPVQNKVINSALAGKAAATHTHNYAASDHTHTPASIGAAAASHTHDYAASDHTHTAADVGALSIDGGTVNGETNIAGVLRVNGQQSFYFQTSTNAQTVGTNNATGGTTICCGASADVAINGANVKTNNILPRANNAYTLGNTTYRWKGIYSTSAVNVSSDERMKRDIAAIDEQELADFINRLNVVSYNYDDDEAERKPRIGLVAQQVQQANPELSKFFVNEDENGMLNLSPADLVFPLIAAVKKLTAEVNELKAKK